MTRPTNCAARAAMVCAGVLLVSAPVALGDEGSVIPSNDPDSLSTMLLKPGTGLTIVDASLVVHFEQGSTFSAASTTHDLGFGVPRAVLLSTGSTAEIDQAWTEVASSYHEAAGDATLEAIENAADPDIPPDNCRDVTALTLQLQASCSTTEVSLDFIAATEEFPGNPAYDDTAMIWIDTNQFVGNVGFIGGEVICVNTVNTWQTNPPPHADIAYNSQTSINQAVFPVDPGEEFTLIIAIGDFSNSVDHGWGDSGIFLANLMGNEVPDPCPTDTDDSNATDVTDLLAVLGDWGPCCGCPSDTNSDGAVDITDLLNVLGEWGPCPPPPGS